MGSISLNDLFGLDLEDDPQAMGQVGGVPVSVPAMAMLLRRDPDIDGEYVFDREVPVRFAAIRRSVQTSGAEHSWLRLEVKAGNGSGIREGDWFACAETPYSSFWSGGAPFKGPNRKGRGKLDSRDPGSAEEALDWLENEKSDFWETGSSLTAGIFDRKLGKTFMEAARNTPTNATYALGVCPAPAKEGRETPLNEAVATLFRCKAVRELLRQTAKGQISFTYMGAGVVAELSRHVRESRDIIMFMSIRQALAGPVTGSEACLGKPVTTLVGQIYRDHLNNMNRWQESRSVAAEIELDPMDGKLLGDAQVARFHAIDREI